MSDKEESVFSSSDYAVIAITAAVAGVAVSYPRKAHALYVIDDIAIAIANGVTEMYRHASEELSKLYEEREKTADEMKQFAYATMGDSINAVKTTINNKRRVIESYEFPSSCVFFDGVGYRLQKSVNQNNFASSNANLSGYLTQTKLTKSDAGFNVPTNDDPVTITASISAPSLLSVKNAISNAKSQIENLSQVTASFLTNVPYALSTTSHIDFVMQYRNNASQYDFINSVYSDTETRLRSTGYYEDIYASESQSAAMHDYLFNIGKEASHWLEMYRQNEMQILSLVQRLVVR